MRPAPRWPASSMLAFPWDLDDAGPEVVLDRIANAGLTGVAIAASYHACHDVLPHNPVRRQAVSSTGGLLFAYHRPRWVDSAIAPRRHELAPNDDGGDVFARAVDAARSRDLAVDAWTVFAHVDRPDLAEAGFTRVDAWGTRFATDLCLSHPSTAVYVHALTADVAARGVSTILAEGLHWLGFGHGAHHERCFARLDWTSRFLLGLCFCRACRDAAANFGVDAERVAGAVRSRPAVRGEGDEPGTVGEGRVGSEEVNAIAGGEMAGYLAMRTAAVTRVAEIVMNAAKAEGVDAWFLDSAGAELGYGDGEPRGDPAASYSWTLGVDLAAVAATGMGIEALAYARDPERVADDLAAYRAVLPAARIGAMLRPMGPDNAEGEDLVRKVNAVRAVGADRIDFYHYGLAPLDALDRVRVALRNGPAS